MTAKEVVLAFWQTMNSNDFYQAAAWLADDFCGHWPQSGELINGRENFALINSSYPANGLWTFTINSVVAEADQVVTDVSVSDGVVKARAITFHTVAHGLIRKQIEYWPDNFAAPEWRRQWVTLQHF